MPVATHKIRNEKFVFAVESMQYTYLLPWQVGSAADDAGNMPKKVEHKPPEQAEPAEAKKSKVDVGVVLQGHHRV